MFDPFKFGDGSYRRILNALTDGVSIVDSNGLIVEVNPAFCDMYGYARDEVVGMNALGLIVPEYHPVFKDFISSLTSSGRFKGETIDLRKDGSQIEVEIHGRRIEVDGRPCLVAVLRDMTEENRIKRELERAKSRFADLYDNAPDMYVSVDAKTSFVTQCNQTVVDKTGFSREEILGRPIFDRYHPQSILDAKEAFERFRELGDIHEEELALLRKDGGKIEVSLNVTAIRDKTGAVVQSRSAWRDITEKNAAKHAMQRQKDRLQKAISEIKKLSGMLPICASCKMIRDDNGTWQPIEKFIDERSEAQFSHSLCPLCSQSLYPEFNSRK